MAMDDTKLPLDPDALRHHLRSTADQPPDNPHRDNGPWDFLEREPAAVVDSLVRPILHELLTDGDEAVRRQALSVLTNLPTCDDTIARLFEAAHRTELYQTPALWWAMCQALSVFSSASGREREAAALTRALIGAGVPSAGTATLLAWHEPDFAVDVVARAGDAAPGFAAQVAAIFAGYRRDRLMPYLARIASLSLDTRRDAWDRMQTYLALSPEDAALIAAGHGVDAAGARPEPDAVRAALGL
jgi:hypothetical protein